MAIDFGHEFLDILVCTVEQEILLFYSFEMYLRGVISKIRAKWGMVIMGDTADPNSALCIHMIH